MSPSKSGLRVLDLFCGAGGFSEGFRQAGYDVIGGFDSWGTALQTYSHNGLGKTDQLNMRQLIDTEGYELAKKKAAEFESSGRIDVLIGSPPCTEFSYAKNGGQGDIEKGMLLVRANLVFAVALKPRFWLLENVSRLESAIQSESVNDNPKVWHIPLRKLGVNEDISDWECVQNNCLVIEHGKTYNSSEFRSPQARKRFIAGNLDCKFIDGIIGKMKTSGSIAMRECIESLEKQTSRKQSKITDPNYPHHTIPVNNLRDYDYNPILHPMYWEELRYLKQRHIQYGKIAFPDDLDKPSRTIMSTQNPSARESIVFDTKRRRKYQGKSRPVFRHLRVREAACLQGFPLGFQFAGDTLNTRFRQIGNAVPCQLSFALALSILDAFNNLSMDSFEDDDQRSRLAETMRRRKANGFKPIIIVPNNQHPEAKDLRLKKYAKFRARDGKHLRRKMSSSKIPKNSAVVIFENTDWDSDGNRFGGFWKSCMQLGVGGNFHQVYLDDVSVAGILKSINQDSKATEEEFNQMTLETGIRKNQPCDFKDVLRGVLQSIDQGIPVVSISWIAFPGYHSSDSKSYLKRITKQRLPLPSAKALQTMFTANNTDTKGNIGPMDLFDGLDALMLKHLTDSEVKWDVQKKIRLENLRDKGVKLHKKRISPKARDFITGKIPVTTLLSSLVSIHVLYRMHSKDNRSKHPMFKSIKKSWTKMARWCRFEQVLKE